MNNFVYYSLEESITLKKVQQRKSKNKTNKQNSKNKNLLQLVQSKKRKLQTITQVNNAGDNEENS